MSDPSFSSCYANISRNDSIIFETRALSTLQPANSQCFGSNRQAFAATPAPKQCSATIAPGRLKVRTEERISSASFCSGRGMKQRLAPVSSCFLSKMVSLKNRFGNPFTTLILAANTESDGGLAWQSTDARCSTGDKPVRQKCSACSTILMWWRLWQKRFSQRFSFPQA